MGGREGEGGATRYEKGWDRKVEVVYADFGGYLGHSRRPVRQDGGDAALPLDQTPHPAAASCPMFIMKQRRSRAFPQRLVWGVCL